ncbi:MAG: HlyD family type I secretion periplasmic adaptor subunit, partial [Sphingomonadaceae bacterium]
MSAYGDVWASIRAAVLRDQQAARPGVSETDFLPAALEVVERPISPMARRTAYVLLAGLAVLLLWLALGRMDIIASAEGRLEPV